MIIYATKSKKYKVSTHVITHTMGEFRRKDYDLYVDICTRLVAWIIILIV